MSATRKSLVYYIPPYLFLLIVWLRLACCEKRNTTFLLHTFYPVQIKRCPLSPFQLYDLILVFRRNHFFIILKSTAYFISSQLEFTRADLRHHQFRFLTNPFSPHSTPSWWALGQIVLSSGILNFSFNNDWCKLIQVLIFVVQEVSFVNSGYG